LIAVAVACSSCASIVGLEEGHPPRLDSLEVSAGTLDPAFDPDVTEYHVDVGAAVDHLVVTPGVPPGVTADVSGRDPDPTDVFLVPGTTTITVDLYVNPMPGTIPLITYTIDVQRGGVVDALGSIVSPHPDHDDNFGRALAANDGRYVIGVPGEASAATGVDGNEVDNSAPRAGAAYLFDDAGALLAYLKADNTGGGDAFGAAVAIDGDLIVVGAPAEDGSSATVDDDTMTDAGAAYVYRWDGAAWQFDARLKASNVAAGDRFGTAVAILGNVVVVGAPGEDAAPDGESTDPLDGSSTGSGAVYVFAYTGTWQQTRYVKAAASHCPCEGDAFGSALAIDTQQLLVGAPDSEASGATDGGAAMTFDPSSLAERETVIPPMITNARFGATLAEYGTDVLLGGPGASTSVLFHHNSSGFVEAGRLDGSGVSLYGGYAATGSGTVLLSAAVGDATPLDAILAPDGALEFGASLAIMPQDGPVHLAVGAPGAFGVVYLYESP
jgi:hypothetical protein